MIYKFKHYIMILLSRFPHYNCISICDNQLNMTNVLVVLSIQTTMVYFYKRLREENHVHESILFGFPGTSDDVIVINYCILYAKYYIYLETLRQQPNTSF